MRADIKEAIERLRDPSSRSWFRERCARWPERRAELQRTLERAGLPLRPGPTKAQFRPDLHAAVQPVTFTNAEFAAEYRAEMDGSCLADVYTVNYFARVKNAAPEDVRLDPFCEVRAESPLTKTFAAIEDLVVPELGRLGWRRMSDEEASEVVPGLGQVSSLLQLDINGWLDDHEPLPPLDESPIAGLRSTLESLYRSGPDVVRAVASASPPWLSEIEAILGDVGTLDRLSPIVYPSVTWTVDFGEVRNGNFHARFFSDVHVSKLAPIWYYSDRFVVAHANPDAISHELEGWTIKEIGYLKEQTAMISAVRAALARRGIVEFDDYYLWFVVPSPIDGFVQFGELAFRDPLHVCEPAPRVEKEGIDRHVRPRIGHLRGDE